MSKQDFAEVAHIFCTKGAGDREWSIAVRRLEAAWELAECVRKHQHALIVMLREYVRLESVFKATGASLHMHYMLGDFEAALMRDRGHRL